MLCELYGAILFVFLLLFHVLKQVPIYFSCLGECCNAVKLHKCFVDYESSADFPLACGWVAQEYIFIFLVNLSFKNTMQHNICSLNSWILGRPPVKKTGMSGLVIEWRLSTPYTWWTRYHFSHDMSNRMIHLQLGWEKSSVLLGRGLFGTRLLRQHQQRALGFVGVSREEGLQRKNPVHREHGKVRPGNEPAIQWRE